MGTVGLAFRAECESAARTELRALAFEAELLAAAALLLSTLL